MWKFISKPRLPSKLAACLQTGRKRGLAMTFNTQLPNRLHRAIGNECSEAVMFRLNESSGLDFPVARGFDAPEVQSLPDLHFTSRTEQESERRGALKV